MLVFLATGIVCWNWNDVYIQRLTWTKFNVWVLILAVWIDPHLSVRLACNIYNHYNFRDHEPSFMFEISGRKIQCWVPVSGSGSLDLLSPCHCGCDTQARTGTWSSLMTDTSHSRIPPSTPRYFRAKGKQNKDSYKELSRLAPLGLNNNHPGFSRSYSS